MGESVVVAKGAMAGSKAATNGRLCFDAPVLSGQSGGLSACPLSPSHPVMPLYCICCLSYYQLCPWHQLVSIVIGSEDKEGNKKADLSTEQEGLRDQQAA